MRSEDDGERNWAGKAGQVAPRAYVVRFHVCSGQQMRTKARCFC